MFDDENKNTSKEFTNKDLKLKLKEVETPKDNTAKIDTPKIPQMITFGGPMKIKMRVLRAGNYRLNGKIYKLDTNDYFDGDKLSPSKRDILVSTKFIVREG